MNTSEMLAYTTGRWVNKLEMWDCTLEKLGSNLGMWESNLEMKVSTWENLVNMMAMMASSFCLTREYNLGKRENKRGKTENTMEM